MHRSVFLSTIIAVALAGTTAFADMPSAPTRRPTRAPADFVKKLASQDRHQRLNKLSPETRGLVASGQFAAGGRLPSFATFSGSFASAGVTYPYVMAGRNPRRGGETEIDTSFIAISFVFDEFVDASGNPLVFDAGSIVRDVLGSPSFVPTRYSDGFGQFADAVQRASFWNVMGRDWHTTLESPRVLTPVTIEVPPGFGEVFISDSGQLFGVVDDNFFLSQLNTIVQLEDLRTDELPILVSHNVFIFSALGFHTAFDVADHGRKGIQTLLWSSWLDESLFGAIFADATTLTHEVSEWMADPFVNNMTPDFAIPNSTDPTTGQPVCMNLLEVGDPIEFLDTQMFPVTIRGKTYHTQNETLLPWFSREVPSSAFQGAYSYPDTTVLTAPSDPCPTN